jgi:carboxypeptidase C (cathepsin A)
MSGYKSDLVSVFCYVDNQGTIDFNFYDEENDEERVVNDTIEEAYYEAMSAYETGDLESSLNYYIFNYLTKKLEKYGIPIDVELELKTLD